ncbi:alkaline phosphatase family protein [Sodiomyces alkalinus F11]|uniref:Alkaline phosphatase family protein n=1 Tax=Sodiomyces alkalinus (strain CBS 110278 / VKM F-3762 / F11) TaxID=1314773 RepID=A0A3N2Q221_SODAK|nr:alkaline phosphatase family protein [Sodiomyces alkalinus F11]ROT40809.1 alkaline phosphatase family protein [Sodiomyces alkalinus F11]
MAVQERIAKCSSTGIRILSYIFFRWVAGPPALSLTIYTLFALYVPSFISAYLKGPSYEVISDEIDVKSTEPTATGSETERPAVVESEVEVDETIVMREKPTRPWSTLLTGSPDRRRPLLSLLTFLINLALVAMVTDVLFRARYFYPNDDLSFVRLGYVSPTEASFVVREPDQARLPVTLELHTKDVPGGPVDTSLWLTGGSISWTDNSTDYTAVIDVPLRYSRQRIYEWRTSNNHSGEFIAPPKPGYAPEHSGGKFTFLSTSCILPRFPYNPLDSPLAIPGLRHLARLLPDLQAQFMLFLGDFIYIDVPRRLGLSTEDYRQKYRHVYASPDWAPVAQNLSWIHVLDDHEIANDWSANTTGVYEAAVDPWHHYQASANPPPAMAAGSANLRREGATYFEFVQGPASFFLLDTRTHRSHNDEPFDSPEKTMLGAQQLEDFLAWLQRPEPKGVKWKIVASSVPLTKNWPVNTKDTWGGFLFERQKVLQAMWDVGARGVGVVVVSGDRHEFAATKFPPPKDGRWPESAAPYEFSCSPLNQFSSPIPTYRQYDEEDVGIKYIHSGNSKFGALTIENHEEGHQSTLTYRLFIDGREVWDTVIVSPPEPEEKKVSGSFWDRIKGF